MSFVKSALVISAMAFFGMASTAQAIEVKTGYEGLSCVPHGPQPDPNNYDYIYEYYGSDIINTHPDDIDPATGAITGYHDLGVNCSINRTLYPTLKNPSPYLKSVSVVLSETDPTTWVDTTTNQTYGNSNCHTHIEYPTAGSITVLYGADVYTQPGTPGSYQTLTLPATVAAPTIDANYNIHCHIFGNDARINGYTVIEKN